MKGTWRPTNALLRAALVSAVLLVGGVVFSRPDLLVLGVPLLVHAVGGVLHRPTRVPRARARLGHAAIREGEGTHLHVALDDAADVEYAAVALAPRRWWRPRPASGVFGAAAVPRADRQELSIPVASLRWGRQVVGEGVVGATSAWAGYRCGPVDLAPVPLTTLPMPGRYDGTAPTPHPIGLVGTNPARRPGGGSEFASIRPFAPGDRLRRVQWRVSLRTGALHVTSTVAEEDASVLLLVDSGVEIGVSGGTLGAASSLDIAVRAAGAVAEHYLRRGDRVALRALGVSPVSVPAASGDRHLRRVLDSLARIVPGDVRDADPRRMRFRVPAGTVVVLFSPMLSEQAMVAVTTLAQRGLTVIVVDTLPQDLELTDTSAPLALAWRMRLVERDALLARVGKTGTPVVAWRGPGTLDEVLRRLGRRASLPRLVRR